MLCHTEYEDVTQTMFDDSLTNHLQYKKEAYEFYKGIIKCILDILTNKVKELNNI